MGAIPIVKTSASDEMFDDLPVLIVEDWNIIDQEFLLDQYVEMQQNEYNMDKLYIEYWLHLIDTFK